MYSYFPICDTVKDPEDNPPAEPSRAARAQARTKSATASAAAAEAPVADIDRFARFMRASKAPPRDTTLAVTDPAKRGSQQFDKVGCATCHVRTLVTAPEGHKINGGQLAVPAALASRVFHPFGDFLLHDMGSLGDGITSGVAGPTMMRTAPLWGVRAKSRLLHDGRAEDVSEAIDFHDGQGAAARNAFHALSPANQQKVLDFINTI